MATIISQEVFNAGDSNIVATFVKLLANSDSVTLPRMSSTSGKVFQLRRAGDPNVTVSQTSATAVSLTGPKSREVLLISQHDGPIPNPQGDGA
jgi:hypothetical protein